MSQPAAKQGDNVVGTDTHIVMIPSPGGPVPTPMPMPFCGTLIDQLSEDVVVENMAAATKGSKAKSLPPHIPAGGPFQKPPSNEGTVQMGSATVQINDKEAARMGDTVMTCNDPADLPNGSIVCGGTVLVG
ncbi:MAG: PAAR domain-containing protein [Deltaproteobacteria bacterium]|nr:PAAR domain-containing protein [Deltaproteobacteria bacterium]MBW2533059.1 PAAR domain-containing protein [Deltaproteobacteria bacterium]